MQANAAIEIERLGTLLEKGLLTREEFDAQKDRLLSASNHSVVPERKVGLLLAVAVGVAPLIFGWILFMPGYSKVNRVCAFIWMTINALFIILLMSVGGSREFAQTDIDNIKVQISQKAAEQGATVNEVELIRVTPQHVTGYAKLSFAALPGVNVQWNCDATMSDGSSNYVWSCKA